MTNKLLIIPARGNSKRIKNKNIKRFNGKPIIFYSIESAIKSKLFNTIHVSTDSKKIYEIVNKIKKGICFKRNKNLAKDSTPLIKVFKYVVEYYKKKNILYDEIWFLNPCSPLITFKDLKKASNLFKNQENNALLSVSKYSPPISWAFKNKKNTLIPISTISQKKRSQLLEDHFYDTGNFGIFASDVFYKKNKICFSPYTLPKNRAIDIDDNEDWKIALKLFNQ